MSSSVTMLSPQRGKPSAFWNILTFGVTVVWGSGSPKQRADVSVPSERLPHVSRPARVAASSFPGEQKPAPSLEQRPPTLSSRGGNFRRACSALQEIVVRFCNAVKGSLLKTVTSGEPQISQQGHRRDHSLLALVSQAAINSSSFRLIQSRHQKPFPYYYSKPEITEAVYSSAEAPI